MRHRAVVLSALLAATAAVPVAQQPVSLRERMVLAEDRRAQQDEDLATLRQGLTHRDPKLRLQAVRGIGRLERPDLIGALTRPLADDNVTVRIEAANAVGQSAKGEKGVAAAKSRLLTRARVEQEPRAWGAVAATLGRLAYSTAADVDQVEAVIARVLPTEGSTAIQIDALLGATEGLEALARQSGKISRLKATTINGLRAAAALEGRAQDADKLARIRRFATLALTAAGAVARPGLEAGIADADEEVRRLTMVAARAEIDGREAVVRRGLSDESPRVRYEALQTWGRQFQKSSCEPVRSALRDSNVHVALLAIDLLGNGCPEGASVELLRSLAEAPLADGWHRPAHAAAALAKVAPAEARPVVTRLATQSPWQVRMYAARAAAAAEAFDTLGKLSRDEHPNVREAAIAALAGAKRPEAVDAALDALTSPDYQLVMTAARALAASMNGERALAPLGRAFARIQAERRDTSRDALTAIRDAVAKLGGPAIPAPAPGPLVTPSLAAGGLDALARTRLRFTIAARGTFELRLLVEDAAVTALHVASLARDGYYNGLTFHRVVPNFVIQGGSPGANEYTGQGPFMRDEVGLVSHRRGTVGISTRGRDTGDAQIFINLVDSPRLDHTYTVFAEVTSGMDTVDAILEGDVIERVDLMTSTS